MIKKAFVHWHRDWDWYWQAKQYRKIHKLNTTQESKQHKIQQNKTTLVQSPLTTLGHETRWACSTSLSSPLQTLRQGYTGCLLLEILKICWNLITLLEMCLNLYGPPGNFCEKCLWSTTLVSRSLKKLVALFYICRGPMSVGWSSSSHAPLNVVDSVHCTAGQSNANMSWIFLEISPGISWKFVQLNL